MTIKHNLLRIKSDNSNSILFKSDRLIQIFESAVVPQITLIVQQITSTVGAVVNCN